VSENYPFIHYTDEAGIERVRRRDGETVCDFCLAPTTEKTGWTYPMAPMPISGPPGRPIDGSDDEWLICQDCHKLLQRSRINDLVERIAIMQPKNELAGYTAYPPVDVRLRYARENVLRFLDARNGAPYRGRPA
jgi:hypothetical protein